MRRFAAHPPFLDRPTIPPAVPPAARLAVRLAVRPAGLNAVSRQTRTFPVSVAVPTFFTPANHKINTLSRYGQALPPNHPSRTTPRRLPGAGPQRV
ncbi:hypothetical protein Q0Z83_057080 [Actinoplanes sichuanensis]|nr:hypothetical protein Q0Z83_057080 [Actinoplanes sichuanensis]